VIQLEVQDNPNVNACCKVEGNLVAQEAPENAPPGLSIRACRECGNRHFELEVDPGEFNLSLT
jgi:hypothetical protein